MKSRKIQAPDLPQILKVKEKFEKDLLRLPNVAGVGIGYKIAKGIHAGIPSLKIYVSKKISCRRLSKNQIIPALLDGIPTDVEEIGSIKANA